MSKKILKVAFQILFVLLFISISSYALLAAYGYQVDVLKQNIVKTSIIDLANTYNDVKVYLNNKQVAEKLPFQIKSIDPGEHYLLIIKEGFIPWQRKVEVGLNVVTKINDIMLIPENFDIYNKNFEIGFEYDFFISSNKWILFISKKNNKIHAYKLNENGSFLIDTLNINLDKDYVFSFAGDEHLVYQYKQNLTMLNLSDKSMVNISVPDEFANFRLAMSPSLKGYYINDGNLYSAEIDDNGEINEIKLLSRDINFKNSNFDIIDMDSGILLISNGGLFYIENGLLEQIDSGVIEMPDMYEGTQKIIYVKNSHEIIMFDLNNKSRYFLGRFGAKIDFLSWFTDDGHILIGKDGMLNVCDFSFSNCPRLPEVSHDEDVFSGIKANQFVVISNNLINSYTYKKPE